MKYIKTLEAHLDHWKRLYAEHICEEKEGRETIEALQAAIEALQKEPCEDAISRQAVRHILNHEVNMPIKQWKKLFELVDDLSPVQPTACIAKISFDDQQMKEMIDKAISNLDFSDLISRQAAIEFLEKPLSECCMMEYIKSAPSVQPKSEDAKFLEFLWNTINPNEMEQYLAMYHSKEEKTNG